MLLPVIAVPGALVVYEYTNGPVPPVVTLVNVTDWPASIVVDEGDIDIEGWGLISILLGSDVWLSGVAALSVTLTRYFVSPTYWGGKSLHVYVPAAISDGGHDAIPFPIHVRLYGLVPPEIVNMSV